MSASDVDDATPIEALKWCFVRRRAAGVLASFGYREVAPPPLELRGTHLLAHSRAAWPVGEDLELRADPQVSLAQLYARARRDRGPLAMPPQRWLLCDVVFDPEAAGPHRYPAWPAVAGALFGVEGLGAELEVLSIAQRAIELPLTDATLRIGFPPGERGDALRSALERLSIRHVEDDALFPGRTGLAFALTARPTDGGEPIAVLRGGRRDTLLGTMGEAPAPLVSVTMSVRRAADCMPGVAESYDPPPDVIFCADSEPARVAALACANRERTRGLRIEVELREVGLDEQRAAAQRARALVVFSDGDQVAVRARDERADRVVSMTDLSSALRRLLR